MTHPAPTEIRVEELHKAFDDNVVLRGVSLEVRRGELVALVGASGCGKTVLMHHIIGHLKADRGRVLVADHEAPGAPLRDVGALDEEQLDKIRIHSAVVFQKNALFSASVHENIALWLREIRRLDEATIRERVLDALAAVGFGRDEQLLGRHRDQLSGGMAKRVAIARALAMRPIVMFYDEPTTGLDPASAAQIHELILSTHGRDMGNEDRSTTVVITHDKDLLRRVQPRIVMLHEGRVEFDGPYRDFEVSDSPHVRPYLEVMPILHGGGMRVA